jgi:hypothetical protein
MRRRTWNGQKRLGLVALVLAPVSALMLMVACGNDKPAASAGGGSAPLRDITIRQERCTGDAQKAEVEGKTTITKFFIGGAEVCRAADFDRDGKPDLVTFLAGGSLVRRREVYFVGTGRPQAIELYEAGTLKSRELDTYNRGVLDTWETYDASGKIAKRERDVNGDGRIDQFWVWEGQNIVLMTDKNADGLPDPETATVWTSDGLAARNAVPSAGALPSASAAPSAPPVALTPSSTMSPSAPDAGVEADAAAPRRKR